MSKRTLGLTAALALCAGGLMSLPATPAHAAPAPTKCRLHFTLEGWSPMHQRADGRGSVTCDNGQYSHVAISVQGGGLTAGKYHAYGFGDISNVRTIKDVFGDYAQAGASAGVVNSGTAQVLTKGTVSIALRGSGEGVNLGAAVDTVTIYPTN
jgi:hypothetical protein